MKLRFLALLVATLGCGQVLFAQMRQGEETISVPGGATAQAQPPLAAATENLQRAAEDLEKYHRDLARRADGIADSRQLAAETARIRLLAERADLVARLEQAGVQCHQILAGDLRRQGLILQDTARAIASLEEQVGPAHALVPSRGAALNPSLAWIGARMKTEQRAASVMRDSASLNAAAMADAELFLFRLGVLVAAAEADLAAVRQVVIANAKALRSRAANQL